MSRGFTSRSTGLMLDTSWLPLRLLSYLQLRSESQVRQGMPERLLQKEKCRLTQAEPPIVPASSPERHRRRFSDRVVVNSTDIVCAGPDPDSTAAAAAAVAAAASAGRIAAHLNGYDRKVGIAAGVLADNPAGIAAAAAAAVAVKSEIWIRLDYVASRWTMQDAPWCALGYARKEVAETIVEEVRRCA